MNKSDSDILKAIASTDQESVKTLLIELWGHRQLVRRIKGHMETIELEVMQINTQMAMEIYVDTTEFMRQDKEQVLPYKY